MADKPSRALVLYGDGLARSINPSHAHLHSLASRASCGFLALPHSPPSETEDERLVRELAHLLDACEASPKMSGGHMAKLNQKISERFMGMRAAIITNNLSLKSLGSKIGFTVLELSQLNNNNCLTEQAHDVVVSELLDLLGFQGGSTLETSQLDFVLVHIGAGGSAHNGKDNVIPIDAEYINGLVGKIMQVAQPGSEIGSRLHFSIVMSYGHVSKDDESCLSVLMDKDENSHLSFLYPRQSYTLKGGNLQKNIRHHCPLLLAQWQDAVTRKDMAETFSFKDFKEHSGNLTIPADRFLYEVAFKLWKAPKYGA